MQAFLIALQFLSQFPVTASLQYTAQNQARSLIWYPVVGGLMGGVLAGVAWLLPGQMPLLNAAILLGLWVLMSGALHLDGLADSADALMGAHGDSARALEIMKDPRSGPVAVSVLVLVLMVKLAALYSVLQQAGFLLLIVPLLLGRCVPLLLFLTTPYIRRKGLGENMSENRPDKILLLMLALSIGLTLILCSVIQAAIVGLGITLSLFYLRHLMIKHIQGMTGDTIGASIELVELVAIVLLAYSI